MKKLIYLLLFSLVHTVSVGQLEPEKILDSLLTKLHSIDNMEYEIKNEFYSKTNDYHSINYVEIFQKQIAPDSLYKGKYTASDFSDGYIYKDKTDSFKIIFDGDYYVDLEHSQKLAKTYNNRIKDREYYISPIINRSMTMFYLERQLKFYKDKGYNKLFDEVHVIQKDSIYKIKLKALNRNIALGTVNIEADYHTIKIFKIDKKEFFPKETFIAGIKPSGDTIFYRRDIYSNYKTREQEINALASIPDNYKREVIDPNPNPQKISEGTKAPLWNLPGLKTDSINLTKLKNKRVLLQFTSMNCGFCVKSIPFVNKLNNIASKNKSLELLTIFPLSNDRKKLSEFKNKHNLNAQVLYDANKTRKDYDIQGFPTFVLIDENGLIDYIKVGYNKDFEKEIQGKFIDEKETK